jgi:hypothetical protein
LSIAALNTSTSVETDIDSAAELDVARVGKFESSEFCDQEISSIGGEIFEQIRIDGTSKKEFFVK